MLSCRSCDSNPYNALHDPICSSFSFPFDSLLLRGILGV